MLREREWVATGPHRKAIEEWQREVAKLGRKTAYAVVPTMAVKGAELQWYEGWGGL